MQQNVAEPCAENTAAVKANTDKATKRGKFIKRKKVDVSFQHANV